jgi:hypothetical protein
MGTDFSAFIRYKFYRTGGDKLTSSMATGLGVVHDEYERLRRSLLLKPEPSVFCVVRKIINLPDMGWNDTVCRYEIIWFNTAAIAQRKRAVFKH